MSEGLLTKEKIMSTPDLAEKIVEVKEWGGSVKLRALNGKERDEFESYLITNPGKDYKINMKGARSKLLSMAIIGADGKPMFSQAELESKSGTVLNKLFEIAQSLSGLSDSDIEKGTADLKAGQAADSPSA